MKSVVRAPTVVELLERSTSPLVVENDGEWIDLDCRALLDRGAQIAASFSVAGLVAGDRVAVQMDNGLSYLEVLAACAVGRFVAMSVNSRFSDQLAESLIARSGATLTIRSRDDLASAGATTAATGSSADVANPADRFVIFTTSGTTSAPKLVVHQQRSIAVHAGDVADRFGYNADSVMLMTLPLCGTFGLTAFAGALAGHSRLIIPTSFDAQQAGSLVEQHGVTTMHGSDDMFHRLLLTDADLSTIEVAGYGRFNSSLDGIVSIAEKRGVRLAGLYGMSEVQALFTFRDPTEPLELREPGGGSLTSAAAAYRVVVDQGDEGELQLQGPSLFEGYLADGGAEIDLELTRSNFDGAWFRTGDLAKAERPTSFQFLTRMGDVLRLSGFLVAPAEIEAALIEVDGIAAAQVVAVERPNGNRPVAFVLLDDDPSLNRDTPFDDTPFDDAAFDDALEQRAIAHCRETLAKFKAPVRVVPLDAFPVTDGPNGVKIQRAKLRKHAAGLF